MSFHNYFEFSVLRTLFANMATGAKANAVCRSKRAPSIFRPETKKTDERYSFRNEPVLP